MRTNRPSLLPATLGVALVVFGVTTTVLLRSGPLDPRVALAGLAAAAGLTVALVVMIWARHRTEATLAREKNLPAAGAGGPGALVVVPLGQGQAAVIFDEPAVSAPPGSNQAADRRAAGHTADAIWAAVDAAVAAEATAGPPAAPPPPRRPGSGNPPAPDAGTR